MFGSVPSDAKTFEEAKAALRTPFLDVDLGIQAIQALARGLLPEDAAVLTASLDLARQQGFRQGLREGLNHPTVQNNRSTVSNKYTNINSGTQQGIATGGGTAIVTNSQANAAGAPETFDQSQFRAELIEVLGLVVDRIEAIDGDSADAAQVLVALRKADLSQAKTLDDVRTMLENLWDPQMKAKYSTLQGLFASHGILMEAIKTTGQVAKLLAPLISG